MEGMSRGWSHDCGRGGEGGGSGVVDGSGIHARDPLSVVGDFGEGPLGGEGCVVRCGSMSTERSGREEKKRRVGATWGDSG
eukprot:scaffold27677_cov101-Isochrysis_galbana.AAC.2